MSTNAVTPPRVPPQVLLALRDKWHQAQGAASVCAAAQQHAEAAFRLYQAHFAMCLQAMELDPSGRWEVDFSTGELRPAPSDAVLAHPPPVSNGHSSAADTTAMATKPNTLRPSS